MPRFSVYFLRFLFWFCVLMLRYLGSPVQPSLDNINSGGLFWSSVITSGHWERERAGSNTIQHLHCPPAPLISTYNINLNHQPRTYPPHHAIDQHRTDITDIADTLKAKECPFVIVYIMYYIMYSILLIVRISQKTKPFRFWRSKVYGITLSLSIALLY